MTDFDLNDVIAHEALKASRRWPGILDKEDIQQELHLYLLTTPSAQKYCDTHPEGYVRKALQRAANKVCSRTRIDYECFSGNWCYSGDEIRRALGQYFAEDHRLNTETKVDIDRGLKKLRTESESKYTVLVDKYTKVDFEEKRRVAASKALRRLVEIMNRHRIQDIRDYNDRHGVVMIYK